MAKPVVLVIDVGTTIIKTTLFDFTCHPIDQISCPHQSTGLELCSAAERWWTIVSESAASLSARNSVCRVTAVGITGFMHSVVALDKSGNPLSFSPEADDVRKSFDAMVSDLGEERIYQVTGSRLHVTSVPSRMMAWRQQAPAEFSRIATILPVKDYLRYRLTGDFLTDEIDACGTMFYDVYHRRWDPALLTYCGLKERNLPPIAHCTERAGFLTPEAARTLGLSGAVPVTVGGGDDIEILGSGARFPGQVCEHVGSTGSFLMPLDEPRSDDERRLELYPGIAREQWVLGGSCSNVTRALDWFLVSSLYNSGGAVDWRRVSAELYQAFGKVDSDRPLFLPYLYGERAPVWNSDLCGTWIGLRSSHTTADLLLSVVEGICFSLRSILDVYSDLGLKIDTVYSSGGLNQLDTRRLRASLYGKPIRLVRNADPTSFATAALALCALGELSDPWEAVEWLNFEPEIEPESGWQSVLNERFLIFAEQTKKLAENASACRKSHLRPSAVGI